MSTIRDSLHEAVSRRTDPSMLAFARVMAGCSAILAALESWRVLRRLVRPLVVKLPLLPGLPLLPASAVPVFIASWLLAALLFTIGWRTRAAGAVLAFLAGYTVALDQQTYSNHLYLLATVVALLTISDCGAAASVDARRDGPTADVAAWPVMLLKVQLTVVYVFSCAAKLTRPYLDGEILALSLKHEGWLALPDSLRLPAVLSTLALASIALELFVALGLWFRRLRGFAIGTGVAFHTTILLLVDSSRLSLAIFALAMFAMYALFVDPRTAAEWIARVRTARSRLSAGVPSSRTGETGG